MGLASGLQGRVSDGFINAVYLGLAGAALQFGPGQKTPWAVCIGLLAALSLFAWLRALGRVQATTQLAPSRIGSAAQGYVELQGRASADPANLAISPASGQACIWWHHRVYEKNSRDDSWREIQNDVSTSTFELVDATGTCQVDPEGAQIMGQTVRTTYPSGYKHVEELLWGGAPIYVLGEFVTIGGAQTALSLSEDVGALLSDWKKNPVALKKRFDLDGNGQIDEREWALARQLATRTIELQHRQVRSQPGVHVLRSPQNGRLFLVSSLSPQKIRFRYQLWSVFHLTVLVLSSSAYLYWR